MQRALRSLLTPIFAISLCAPMLHAALSSSDGNDSRGGAVFTMTNDANRNEIIAYQRTPDGQLFEGERFATGGRGSGGTIDPLQSQGSLLLSSDGSLLFAANAGSGTVSVFHVKGAWLQLADRVASGGSEPLAMAMNGSFVYVLNGAAAGSIAVFRWDDHYLRQVPGSTMFLSATSAGGSSITIRPDGKVLAVTERLTDSIDTFRIKADGTLAPIVVNKSSAPGVFSARFAPNGALLVSEVGPAGATDGSTLSSYQVKADGTLTAVTQSIATLGAANCWNAISPDGRWIYTSNAGSNNLSGFAIAKNGALTPIGATIVGENPTGSVNLDITISPDGRFLYSLNSGGGTIGTFQIQTDGTLLQEGETEGLPKAAGLNGIVAR